MKRGIIFWTLLISFWISKGAEIIVEEGDDFILECCRPNVELTGDVFVWNQNGNRRVFKYDAGAHSNNGGSGQARQFLGRVSNFPEALKDGNASIKIQAAKISDSGTYTCHFPREGSGSDQTIEVTVGVSPKPRLLTTDSLQLICEVDGAFPEPKVEFLDGSGTRIPPEDTQTSVEEQRYYVTASVQVKETGSYTCEVTQEQIHRQTSTSTFILTYSEARGWRTAFIISVTAFIISVILSVSFIVVLLVMIKRLKQTGSKGPEDIPADGSAGLQLSEIRTPQEDIRSSLLNGSAQRSEVDQPDSEQTAESGFCSAHTSHLEVECVNSGVVKEQLLQSDGASEQVPLRLDLSLASPGASQLAALPYSGGADGFFYCSADLSLIQTQAACLQSERCSGISCDL